MLIEKLRKQHPQHWANSTAIRVLTLDAVAAANSGHSGMPMGMADVATVLFFNHLKFDPKAPLWTDRDRLILSAGHGSMLLYSLLYLTGYNDFPLEEIKNLKLEAARNEYELRRLRDQMNPHFIFNAMNTIRALIDEDPTKAKNAVTQLSNVLRSSLQTGKQEFITLEKELQIVNDYLEIEKARYEERLQVDFIISEETTSAQVPPLMLQTLVENCIKHGIAKLPEGGKIKVITNRGQDHVSIDILNSGKYTPDAATESSLGLENTRYRLDLSYGNKAWLTIGNTEENYVRTHIHIPLKNKKA